MSNPATRITGQSSKLTKFQDFSFQCFGSVEEFIAYTELVKQSGDSVLLNFLDRERTYIENYLVRNANNTNNQYGLLGTTKAPVSYLDAMNRKTFVYQEEYEKVKDRCRKLIDKALEKNSLAEAMKSKLVFTERELGEFIYQRAAMALNLNLYYYSFVHNKKIEQEDIIFISGEKEEFKYVLDGSPVFLCVRVSYPLLPSDSDSENELEEVNSREEYVKADTLTDELLDDITKKGGVIDTYSEVKKVYQYKEKQPRIKNAVKIIMATTFGGFTKSSVWGDFYTGVTAALVTEYLEARDYSVEIELVLGGGRCNPDAERGGFSGCVGGRNPKYLNTPSRYGRRYLGITVKKFDEQLDLDNLLYWIADPSATKIKLLPYFNLFHWLYGDVMSNQNMYWHGIEKQDLICPIGTFYKQKDVKKGMKDLLYFSVIAVDGIDQVANAILKIVLESENENLQINQRANL
jgi:hypothetical protein